MSKRSLLWLLATMPGVVACQTVASSYDRPALITAPTDASRAALQQTVNTALHTEVLLADDALTSTSLLIIERAAPRSIEGSHSTGRNMEMPIQFRLVIDGDDCVLIDQRNESRYVLRDTTCIVEE